MTREDEAMRLFAFAAALRRDSFNRKLVRLAATAAEKAGTTVDLADFHEFDMPLYDGDVEAASGAPDGAKKLRERFAAADAFMIASPEYNFSIPGTLKNAIDWATRRPDNPFPGKVAALMGASPGAFGAVRSVATLRLVLTATGVFLLPGTVLIPHADQAFEDDGRLKDPKSKAQVENLCAELLRVTAALKSGQRPG